MRGAMSCNPTQLWNRLSPSLQTRICADLTALFQEVIDAQLRSHYPPTSDPQGRHLHPAIHPPSGGEPSRKLALAVCSARARQLGWPDEAIDIIDDDLGLTAATAHHRAGFNALVAQVTLEQVGLILSYDVTRLSRNCSDWYPLLDLCGYKGCLIADGDGMYDPATVNGRLLLGLKGTLSEWERHTMKARLTAGLLHKAERGALALQLPTGLVRNHQGKVLKIPNQEAQARLALVFETFLQCRSASRVVDEFHRHDLLL